MFPPCNAINILVIYIGVAGDEMCLKHRCVWGSGPGGSCGSSAGMLSADTGSSCGAGPAPAFWPLHPVLENSFMQ